jgi:hypothetical protein
LFNVGEEAGFFADGGDNVPDGIVDVVGAGTFAACDGV